MVFSVLDFIHNLYLFQKACISENACFHIQARKKPNLCDTP
jgi:hypothetical protein